MPDIRHEGVAHAPLSVAFAYIDDHRNVPTWMFGVSEFAPHDPAKDQGLGAVFDAVFHVKPVKLRTRVEITRWEQDALIELTSVEGFENSSSWRFEADGPERTRISVVFHYALPGGLAGKALGKAFEPVVALTVKQSDAHLRARIEASHAAAQDPQG